MEAAAAISKERQGADCLNIEDSEGNIYATGNGILALIITTRPKKQTITNTRCLPEVSADLTR